MGWMFQTIPATAAVAPAHRRFCSRGGKPPPPLFTRVLNNYILLLQIPWRPACCSGIGSLVPARPAGLGLLGLLFSGASLAPGDSSYPTFSPGCCGKQGANPPNAGRQGPLSYPSGATRSATKTPGVGPFDFG